MELLQRTRHFWYNNEPGPFMLGKNPITRKQIQIYGGPAPSLDACPTCQGLEWLSRMRQENLFQDHTCPANTKAWCAALCIKQGDDLWTNHHQNFQYANGCDPDLDAPRACLFLSYAGLYDRYLTPSCDAWVLSLRRALAQVGTVEIRQPGEEVNWDEYDWVWMLAKGYKFRERLPIPVVMYGGDTNHGNIQEMLDMEPEVLLTPYPSAWRDNFRISGETRVVFGCRAASSFYTKRQTEKEFDLLVIGALKHSIYVPRRELTVQIRPLAEKYAIEFSHRFGWLCGNHPGPVQYKEGQETINYLDKWSEFLSSARYVVFGPTAGVAKEYVTIKVYECLGSGAIPILPEVKDFDLLGIEPMIHYIPLSQVWRNNTRLEELLNNYDKYKYIAENAVQWHEENVDRMLFDNFEELIHELTGKRHPKRLL